MVLGKLIHELKYYEQDEAEKFFVIVAGCEEPPAATETEEDKDIWSLVGPFPPRYTDPTRQTLEEVEDGLRVARSRRRCSHQVFLLYKHERGLARVEDRKRPRNRGRDEDKDIWSLSKPLSLETSAGQFPNLPGAGAEGAGDKRQKGDDQGSDMAGATGQLPPRAPCRPTDTASL